MEEGEEYGPSSWGEDSEGSGEGGGASFSRRGDEATTQDTSLYAILHVSRDASDDELKRAYRQLASLYHPDKFTSVQLQELAKENFQRLRSAYEILSDPAKRQVYDIYGAEGISAGLEVGPRLKTKEEIREEFERAREQKRDAKRKARTLHSSSLSVSVTVADALASGLEELPEISIMQMGTQVQAPISDSVMVALGGTVVSRRGTGGGTVFCLLKRQLSPFHSVEVSAATGLRSILSVSSTRQLCPRMSATSGVTWHVSEGALGISNSWTRQLSESSQASAQMALGANAGSSVAWNVQLNPKTNASADIKVGPTSLGVTGSLVRRFSETSQGRIALRCGLSGVDFEVGGSRRVSENSSAGMSTVVGLQGVLWKIRYSRGGQKLVVPILLSAVPRPLLVMAALLLPSTLYALLKRFLLEPYAKRRKQKRDHSQRRRTAQKVREDMAEALRMQELMKAVVDRRLKQKQGGGLVITNAIYGDLAAFDDKKGEGRSTGRDRHDGDNEEEDGEEEDNKEDLPPPFWDVRIPLQFHVDDDSASLLLHKGISKRGVMGSCDPNPGQPKSLRVHYLLHGIPHTVEVGDRDELRLPHEE